ncbi:MAG TPA: DKNYY domain-containing protein [Bacteroidia bacterium]|nr:DKNYY domain-containing protein [Bacteroidia bacterium]
MSYLKNWFIILWLLVLAGCNTSKTQEARAEQTETDLQNRSLKQNIYLIDAGGCIFLDSLMLDSVGNNLYADKKHKIYFKPFDYSDKKEGPRPVLISRLYNACEGDSTFDLRRNIDVPSFCSMGNLYYKDKNKVFIFNQMADGGNLNILEDADVKSFKTFKHSPYATDINHVYYQGLPIEKADPKTFKVIYTFKASDTVGWFGQDHTYYFDGSDICTEEKIKENTH